MYFCFLLVSFFPTMWNTHVQTRKRIMIIVRLVPVLQIFLIQVNLPGSIRVFAWLKIYTTYWRNAYDVVIWYSNTRFFFPDKTGSSYCEPVLYTRQYLCRGGVPRSVMRFHEWCNCGSLGNCATSSYQCTSPVQRFWVAAPAIA